MKLKKNIVAKFYAWIYGDLPQDVCSYFWGALFAVAFFLIFIPGRLLSDRYTALGDKVGRGILFWIVSALLTLTGLAFFPKDFLLSLNTWLMFLLLFGTGLVAWSVVIGLIAGGVYVSEYLKERRRITGQPSIVEKSTAFFGAVRGKYCTKITWK